MTPISILFSNCLAMATAFSLLIASGPARAAELDMTEVPEMYCFGTLRGGFERGDVEKIKPLLEKYDFAYGKRLCLDSPGGSLAEGVALAELLIQNVRGTAVAKGAHCASACAIAFMGGRRNDENDRGDHPDRKLHPLGRLGFHTPKLTVPHGQYDEGTVSKAYNLAASSLSDILKLMPAEEFARSLFIDMLATPAEEMLYVDTVAKAVRWNIDVSPTISPAELTKLSMLRACLNGETGFFDEPSFKGATFERDELEIRVRPASDGMREEYNGMMESGFRQELYTGCNVNFRSHMPGWEDLLLRQDISVTMGDRSEDFSPFALYPAKTPIKSLARANDMKVEFKSTPSEQMQSTITGSCFVITISDEGGALSEDDPCVLERNLSVNSDLVRTRIDSFRWPSGAKTVVKNDDQINGQDVMRHNSQAAKDWLVQRFFSGNDEMTYYMDCWRNSKSGNLFCFASDPAILNDDYLKKVWYKTRLY